MSKLTPTLEETIAAVSRGADVAFPGDEQRSTNLTGRLKSKILQGISCLFAQFTVTIAPRENQKRPRFAARPILSNFEALKHFQKL